MKKVIPGEKALNFRSSEVSWATSKYIDKRVGFAKKIFIYSLTITILTLMTYSYFSKIALSISARGKLVSKVSVVPVVSDVTFKVKSLTIENGKKISEGSIVVQSSNAIPEKIITNVQNLVTEIKPTINAIESDRSCSRCEEKLGEFKSRIFKDLMGNPVLSVLNNVSLEAVEVISIYSAKTNFRVENINLINTIKRSKQKIKKILKSRAKSMLKLELESLKQQEEQARSQLRQKEVQIQTSLANAITKFKSSVETIVPNIIEFNKKNRIIAPRSGIVNSNILNKGTIVQAGVKLFEIIPEDSDLIGELYVLNKDIGPIKMGQQVRLAIDAYPERDYGATFAKVTAIAPTLKKIQGMGEVYVVDLALDKQFVERGSQQYRFKLGMTYEGKIIKKSERMLIVGIRKILNLKDKAFGN